MSENTKEIQSRTLISTESCTFTWSVENFSLCGLQGEEYVSSPVFTTGQSVFPTWGLRLYPNKKKQTSETGEGTVGIFLERLSPDSSAHYANVRISIVGPDQAKYYSLQEKVLFHGTRTCQGFRNIIDRKDLFEKRSRYLVQDTLIIVCELKTSRVDDYKAPVTKILKPLPTVFKKPDSLMRDLQILHDGEMYSDFTIKVYEEDIKVHKLILCTRSSVFNTMLNCEMKEKLTSSLEIKDFDPIVIKMMLRFIYCGQVEDLTPEIAIQLYSAAEKYNLQDLKTVCNEYLSGNINDDNFGEVLTLGKLHREQGLIAAAKEFFCAKTTAAFGETEKWRDLTNTYPQSVIATYEYIEYLKSKFSTFVE